VANGHDVVISNSRGPETLSGLIAELGPKARVIGNVQYKLIEMSIGAEVNGKLIHESEHGAGKSVNRPQVDTTRPVNAGE